MEIDKLWEKINNEIENFRKDMKQKKAEEIYKNADKIAFVENIEDYLYTKYNEITNDLDWLSNEEMEDLEKGIRNIVNYNGRIIDLLYDRYIQSYDNYDMYREITNMVLKNLKNKENV